MMNRRSVKLIITFGILFVSCILVNSCTQSTILPNIWMMHSNSTLYVPANFDIKITGKTVYTYNNEDIPVGKILKQNIEDNIRSSVDKRSKYQYAIIINIMGDNGIIEKYPSIYCDIKIYSETTNDTGQKSIDKLLFYSSCITSSLKDCSQIITNTLNYIFYNAENPKKFLTYQTKKSTISTEQFIIGKSTNIDILHKMNKPNLKTTHNNEKIYKYWYGDDNGTVIFTFDYNNILSDISSYKINRKYELLNIKKNHEIKINTINMIHAKKKDNYELLNKILSKITIGTSKGSVFRIIGAPDFYLENNDEEIFGFHGGRYYMIHIIFKNNTVINKYICELIKE